MFFKIIFLNLFFQTVLFIGYKRIHVLYWNCLQIYNNKKVYAENILPFIILCLCTSDLTFVHVSNNSKFTTRTTKEYKYGHFWRISDRQENFRLLGIYEQVAISSQNRKDQTEPQTRRLLSFVFVIKTLHYYKALGQCSVPI